MENKNLLTVSIERPFIAGNGDLAAFHHRLNKLDCAAILFCRSGWAQVTIDLRKHEIVKNTQVVLLPGTVISLDGKSDDFDLSFFVSYPEMFREACLRLEPSFFHFLKENPCYTLPENVTRAVHGLMNATVAIYTDYENRFRNQIALNHLQSFLLDIYDKTYRYFTKKEIEGGNRQDEIFNKFIALVHEYCTSQRDVTFYAGKLCISTKYLTGICRSVSDDSAKKIIDDFAILEIKVLLQSTKLSIQEIADKLNFPDQSYLGRYFKRHEGISPVEYRAGERPQ
ncbi:helix-turn-helix domain-containing protein [Bacteroides sp.]